MSLVAPLTKSITWLQKITLWPGDDSQSTYQSLLGTKCIKSTPFFLCFRGFKFYAHKNYISQHLTSNFLQGMKASIFFGRKLWKNWGFLQVQTRIAAELGTSTGHFGVENYVSLFFLQLLKRYMLVVFIHKEGWCLFLRKKSGLVEVSPFHPFSSW